MKTTIGIFIGWFFVKTTTSGNIGFASDNRFDASFSSFNIKFYGAKHITVIGNCQRRHFKLFGNFNHVIETTGTIQQGILAMCM